MIFSPKKILWPTDFSVLSMAAAAYARDLCAQYGAELHVVHVAQILVPDSTTAVASAGDLLVGTTDIRAATEARLQALAGERLVGDRSVVLGVRVGAPWYELCEYARQNLIDLIVSATHGVTGFKHVLMGSVAERLVQHSPCPVLIVKSFAPSMPG